MDAIRISKQKEEYFKEFSDKELAIIKNPVFSDFEFGEEDSNVVSTIENQLEYFGRRLTTNVEVPGNIHRPKFFKFWKEVLKAPEFVLKTLSEGYSLPFSSIPPPSFERNNKSCLLYTSPSPRD